MVGLSLRIVLAEQVMSVIKSLVPRFSLYFPHSNIIYYEMTLTLMLEPFCKEKKMKNVVFF
jgi:hypothetical protein